MFDLRQHPAVEIYTLRKSVQSVHSELHRSTLMEVSGLEHNTIPLDATALASLHTSS